MSKEVGITVSKNDNFSEWYTQVVVKAELKASGLMDDKGKLKLKGVSPKMLKRMKQEYVDCPVLEQKVQFVPCFVCPNFQSRVTGKVLCKGDKLN